LEGDNLGGKFEEAHLDGRIASNNRKQEKNQGKRCGISPVVIYLLALDPDDALTRADSEHNPFLSGLTNESYSSTLIGGSAVFVLR
jgi:hypothetical protein